MTKDRECSANDCVRIVVADTENWIEISIEEYIVFDFGG